MAARKLTDEQIIADVRQAAGRFWAKVEKTSTCWLWIGGRSHGYGNFRASTRLGIAAHRASYILKHGRIPYEVDHLCRVTSCVNPAHLEDVTHRENVLRGAHPSAVLHRSGVCKRGHPRTAENTKYHRSGQVAYCRPCRNARRRLRAQAAGSWAGL